MGADDDDPGRVPLLPKLTGEARREALADPGPTWSEWFFRSFARTWVVLGFLIGDVFLIATFAAPLDVPALVAGVGLAFYGEFLLYQYLWYTPSTRYHHRTAGVFARSWVHPVAYGRWTEEAALIRAGQLPVYAEIEGHETGPDPREFL